MDLMKTLGTVNESNALAEGLQAEGLEDLVALLVRFDQLLMQVDEFVAAQAELAVSERTAQPVPDQLQGSIKQFMAAREAWEHEREQQVAQLTQDQDLLAAAWQRLESEERRLLSQRGERKPVTVRNPEITGSSPAIGSNGETEVPKAAASNNEVMMLQYQQLRREMQKHTQRGRR